MKMIKTHIFSLLAALCFIAFAIASAPSQKSLTVKSGQIPPDIKGYNQTLLIQRYSKDWTKYAEKYFEENYTGKFLVCESGEVASTYADLKKYRFLLTREQFTQFDAAARKQNLSQNLCLVDRETGKKYCTKGSTSFYGKLLKAYSKALEDARNGE